MSIAQRQGLSKITLGGTKLASDTASYGPTVISNYDQTSGRATTMEVTEKLIPQPSRQ